MIEPDRHRSDRRGFLKRLCAATAAATGGRLLRPSAGSAAEGAAPPGKARLPVGLVYDDAYKKHDTGPMHPEKPARLDAIMAALSADPPAGRLKRVRPRDATAAEVLACHERNYYQAVGADVQAAKGRLSTGDTPLSKDSLAAALLAAGGAMAAVDAVVDRQVSSAFCAIRPPGHHATPAKGMGFCIFNNAAIAARHAQRKHRLAKVLIVDWDVHHGNGTQDIFYEDPSVLLFSTHQSPWYPGTGRADETGRGKGKGTTINCPFPAGAGRKEILGAFEKTLVPAAERFRPELVIVSAGFDSRKGDPLGRFTLTDADFADLTKVVLGIAARHAGGRVVSVLEGGYDLKGLASACLAHVRALAAA